MESAKEIWYRALGELQLQVSKANYATWLSNTYGLSCQDNVFTVGVPNVFVVEWLSQRLYPLIRKTLVNILHRDIEVRFLVQDKEHGETSSVTTQTDGGTSTRARWHQFNPKHTFDKFVVSDCNRLAYAAALEVGENVGNSFNPLFIYGGTGLGKTHLLHAIGHLAANNGFNAVYITAQQFAHDFGLAAKQKEISEFRNKFKNIDVFLFDDFHFITDKKQTLQCFFHVFEELYNRSRQIVITADCAPQDLQLPASRLKSRLQGGLVVHVEAPDFETRLNILRAKCESPLTPELDVILRALAEKVTENVRQLEGALAYVNAHARLNGTDLSPETIYRLLTGMSHKNDVRSMLETTAGYFGLSFADLTGRRRDKKAVLARHIAIYLLRKEYDYSLTQIGKDLGSRNHVTILHAYKKISRELAINPKLSRQVEEIKAILKL